MFTNLKFAKNTVAYHFNLEEYACVIIGIMAK